MNEYAEGILQAQFVKGLIGLGVCVLIGIGVLIYEFWKDR